MSPSSLTAAGNPTLTVTAAFDPSTTSTGTATETAKSATVDLAPGLLLNLGANPACLTGTPDFNNDAGCQIGTGTINLIATIPGLGSQATTATGPLFLAPPKAAGDLASIDVHLTSNALTGSLSSPVDAPIEVGFDSTKGGLELGASGFPATITAAGTTANLQITGLTAQFDPTLNGQAFTRLPSTCTAAISSMTVTYADGTTGSASGPFTPSPCATVAFAPALSGTVSSDTKGNAQIAFDITQKPGEAAEKSISVKLPSDLSPNVSVLEPCVSGSTTCTLGTATATTPLGTFKGNATLSGTLASPALALVFPAPLGTISGTVSLTSESLEFSGMPDIPISDLTLNVSGPNGQSVFTTTCQSATVTGQFSGQGGQTTTATGPIKPTNCNATGTGPQNPGPGQPGGKKPGPPANGKKPGNGKTNANKAPKGSGSIKGLATGHPKLHLKLTAPAGAKIKSLAIKLPKGLKFSNAALVKHKVCKTVKGHKKCTTTTTAKGLSAGAKSSVALKGGKLSVTLTKPTRSLSLTASGKLITESKALINSVKHHKVKTLKVAVQVKASNHSTKTVTLSLKA